MLIKNIYSKLFLFLPIKFYHKFATNWLLLGYIFPILNILKQRTGNKIIIRNRITNGKTEIKGKDLPKGFTLYSSLKSLITYKNIMYEGKDSPNQTEFYLYEFIKGDDKYEINIPADYVFLILI